MQNINRILCNLIEILIPIINRYTFYITHLRKILYHATNIIQLYFNY